MRTRCSPGLALGFYSGISSTNLAPIADLCLDMLLGTGSLMGRSRMSPHGSAIGWNVSLIQTNPTSKRGSSCTTSITIDTISELTQIRNPEQDHYIMLHCAGSMSWWNTLLSTIRNTQVLKVVVWGLRYTRGRLRVTSGLYVHCFNTVWVSMFEAFSNCTPLRCASESGHLDVAQIFLDHGADVNSQDDDHNTPLNWAAYRGHVDVVRHSMLF